MEKWVWRKGQSLNTAFGWANAYRCALEMQEKIDSLAEIQAKQSPCIALARLYPRETVAEAYSRGGWWEDTDQGRGVRTCQNT